MQKLEKMKRGDSFEFKAHWEGAELSELRCQVRDDDNFVVEIEIESTEESHTFRFFKDDTRNWPIGNLKTDIQRKVGNIVKSSDTLIIPVLEDITHE